METIAGILSFFALKGLLLIALFPLVLIAILAKKTARKTPENGLDADRNEEATSRGD